VRFLRHKAFGRYFVDFYCARAKLVIELDGEVHDTIEAQAYDAVRTETLEARIARQVLSYEQDSRGLRVLRFRNEMVLEELPEVVKKIKEIICTQPVWHVIFFGFCFRIQSNTANGLNRLTIPCKSCFSSICRNSSTVNGGCFID
jgi:very-short-patch-repair endonuclease